MTGAAQAAGPEARSPEPPAWDDMAVVGRVARPHGIRGQVVVNLETDFPYERFRQGERLFAKRGSAVERLTVSSVRFQGGRPIVGWAGIDDINAVLVYVGVELRVPRGSLSALPSGVFYRHDLVGCRVTTTAGDLVGVVEDVEGSLTGSCLVIGSATGEVLVPLAAEICPTVDVAGREIVIDPPEGLLSLNARGASRRS